MAKLTIKDFITFTFAILIAVIGYFINQRLASIDESIKDSNVFQKTQISINEKMNGEINLLKAKDSELEKLLTGEK